MFGRLDRLETTWILLIVLSLTTIAIYYHAPGLAALAANAVFLTLAAIKGRQIVLDYLDLRTAPALWRGLVSGWIILVVLFAWLASAIRILI